MKFLLIFPIAALATVWIGTGETPVALQLIAELVRQTILN